MNYLLYNPVSNNKKGENAIEEIKKQNSGKEFECIDVRTLTDMKSFFAKLASDDEIILAGGDGTLMHFVNDIFDIQPSQKIFYFPSGSGNDFAHDVENEPKENGCFIPLNKFVKSLPVVTVNGKKYYFINGIGFGIDGYCCEKGDELRETSDKPVNYAGIAIKGLLGKFKPSNAKITVDGVTKSYKKVWLAPTMIGKYYGGGMLVTPRQNRLNEDKLVSSLVWHCPFSLYTLCVFPSIFKGEHIKHTKIIETRVGHEVTVEFDKPQALQIDGETIKNVTSYSVSYGK